jgi:hypothetical protein
VTVVGISRTLDKLITHPEEDGVVEVVKDLIQILTSIVLLHWLCLRKIPVVSSKK